MNSPTDLDVLDPDQLRALARQLMTQVDEKTRESQYRPRAVTQSPPGVVTSNSSTLGPELGKS
jgi:hypothetical protein